MYPVSRITGEARAEFRRASGTEFEQEGAAREGGAGGTQYVRGYTDKSDNIIGLISYRMYIKT